MSRLFRRGVVALWSHGAPAILRMHRRAQQLTRRAAPGVEAGVGWILRQAVTHRVALISVLLRALWWGALALLLWGGQRLLGLHPDMEALPQARAFHALMGVTAIAAGILVFAPQRRLRVFAALLALAGGGLGLLAWAALAP